MLILCPWARKLAIWSKKYNNAWNRWMFKVLWPVERSISTPRKIQSTWKSTWERKWLKLRKKHKKQFCTWQRKWWLQKQNSSNKKDNNDVMFLIHFDIYFIMQISKRKSIPTQFEASGARECIAWYLSWRILCYYYSFFS